MSTPTNHRISLTFYRLLVTLNVIGTLVTVAAAIEINLGGPALRQDTSVYVMLMLLSVTFPISLAMLIVKRRHIARLDDPSAWPWWKAVAVNLSLSALVVVVISVIL